MFIETKKKTLKEIINDNFIKYKDSFQLPKKETIFFNLQYSGIQPYEIIFFILKNEIIDELIINCYYSSLKIIKILTELKDKNQIKQSSYIINRRFYTKEFKNKPVVLNENIEFKNTHAKYFLIKTKDNFYVIQSSGNLTGLKTIEFITIHNSKKLYNTLKNGKTETN